MSRTKDLIKEPIERLVAEQYADVLRPADGRNGQEYPLAYKGNPRRFKADHAFRLLNDGWLFIEDDDDVRALHNVTKYWMWMEDQAVQVDVYLIHLIAPGTSDLAEFAGQRAEEEHQRFHYKAVPVQRWEDPAWHDELARILDRVVETGGDGEPPLGPLHEDPAIGMWKDREDLRDSAAWVRELRRREWERR